MVQLGQLTRKKDCKLLFNTKKDGQICMDVNLPHVHFVDYSNDASYTLWGKGGTVPISESCPTNKLIDIISDGIADIKKKCDSRLHNHSTRHEEKPRYSGICDPG